MVCKHVGGRGGWYVFDRMLERRVSGFFDTGMQGRMEAMRISDERAAVALGVFGPEPLELVGDLDHVD